MEISPIDPPAVRPISATDHSVAQAKPDTAAIEPLDVIENGTRRTKLRLYAILSALYVSLVIPPRCKEILDKTKLMVCSTARPLSSCSGPDNHLDSHPHNHV